MELNLENPIFVVYLNVGEMTRQRADEKIAELSNYMSYQNITKWIIPIKNSDSKVELIWQGSKYSTNPGIMNFNNFERRIESTIFWVTRQTYNLLCMTFCFNCF